MPLGDLTQSPAISLGALFLAGSSERGREFTGGESGVNLLAGGFAASSSDYAVNQIRNAAGVDSSQLSDELAQALVGAGVSKLGMIPRNKAMARAIHYDVASQAFGDVGLTLGDLVGDVTDGTSGATTDPNPAGATHEPTMTPGPEVEVV